MLCYLVPEPSTVSFSYQLPQQQVKSSVPQKAFYQPSTLAKP